MLRHAHRPLQRRVDGDGRWTDELTKHGGSAADGTAAASHDGLRGRNPAIAEGESGRSQISAVNKVDEVLSRPTLFRKSLNDFAPRPVNRLISPRPGHSRRR